MEISYMHVYVYLYTNAHVPTNTRILFLSMGRKCYKVSFIHSKSRYTPLILYHPRIVKVISSHAYKLLIGSAGTFMNGKETLLPDQQIFVISVSTSKFCRIDIHNSSVLQQSVWACLNLK